MGFSGKYWLACSGAAQLLHAVALELRMDSSSVDIGTLQNAASQQPVIVGQR